MLDCVFFFFFQAEDGIRDYKVTGVQTCALPICAVAAVTLCAVITSGVGAWACAAVARGGSDATPSIATSSNRSSFMADTSLQVIVCLVSLGTGVPPGSRAPCCPRQRDPCPPLPTGRPLCTPGRPRARPRPACGRRTSAPSNGGSLKSCAVRSFPLCEGAGPMPIVLMAPNPFSTCELCF